MPDLRDVEKEIKQRNNAFKVANYLICRMKILITDGFEKEGIEKFFKEKFFRTCFIAS